VQQAVECEPQTLAHEPNAISLSGSFVERVRKQSPDKLLETASAYAGVLFSHREGTPSGTTLNLQGRRGKSP